MVRQGSRWGSLRIVAEFWKERPGWAVGLVLGMLLASGLTLSFPFVLRLIVDAIRHGISERQFFRYVVILVGLGVLRAIGEVVLPFLRGRMNELYQWRVRSEVFSRLLQMGHTFLSRYPSGDVMERLDHDMGELSFFACSVIFRFIGAVMMAVMTVVLMARMNLLLTALAVLPAGIAAYGWTRFGPVMYRLFMRWRERIAETNSQLQSAFSGIRLVKAFVMEERFCRRFRTVLNSRVDAAVAEARMEAKIEMYYSLIAEGATLLVLWAGGWQVISHSLTLGEFVAFHAYVLMLFGPMFDIGRLVVAGRRAQGTAERILEIRQHPPEVIQAPGPRMPVPAELKLEDVTFAYGDRTVLKGVTMIFPLGKHIGIAGTVGSGKSTVFRLLLRLSDPRQGRVTLGGYDIRELDIVAYRRLFGYAPQEPMLFSDTIRNNILFGRTGVDSSMLERLLVETELRDDVAGFPKGLDEPMGERGARLSGGQRERVAIARALLGEPVFLLFDDAMSALDVQTEQRLVRRLLEIGGSRTLVIASHRLSVLAFCDWVYVLDRGVVREQGAHTELLARQGLYWRLYQRQLIQEELDKL